MPILRYLFGVGGALLCLMFVLNAYVPATPPREQHALDKSIIHVTAAPTGDYVIDHFPAVRGDLASDDAVRQALAMTPPDDARQAGSNAPRNDTAAPPAARKRHVAQRQPRIANGEISSTVRSQTSSNQTPSSTGWSSNSPGNWNSNWSWSGDANRWAANQPSR